MPIIQITPEGYTPDWKWRLVPVDIKSEIHSVYRHAMGQGLREQDKHGVLAFHKSVIETAPPPPAEMLVDAFDDDSGRKLFEAWVLRQVDDYNRLQPVRDKMLLRTAEGDYRQLWVDHCWEGWKAALDAARGR